MSRLLLNSMLVLLTASAPAALGAQAFDGVSIGVAPSYRFFTLDADRLAASDVTLLMMPVAVRVPLSRTLAVDGYTAFARGAVSVGEQALTLSGPVDTNVRLVWSPLEWARVSVAANIPTGATEHDAEEARVAAILATDLLGFAEASFGVGGALTTGIAMAHQLGEWAIGTGVSYRYAGSFQPSANSELSYAPGDELRLRLGLDRNLSADAKLTLGATYQHYSDDEIGERNLFMPGARIRGDAALSFRTGASTWTLYVSDVWRERGDAAFTDSTGTTVVEGAVGSQNMLIAGAAGTVGRLLPELNVRWVERERGPASGMLADLGIGIPFERGALTLVPRVGALLGRIEALNGDTPLLWGAHMELTLRWGP